MKREIEIVCPYCGAEYGPAADDLPDACACGALIAVGETEQEALAFMFGEESPKGDYRVIDPPYGYAAGGGSRIAIFLSPFVGVAEVAEILGWPKGKVSVYHKRGKLPPAYGELKSGPLWKREDIVKFKEQQ